MHPLYDEFISYLNDEDKEKCVQFVLSSLQNQSVNVLALYDEILTPAMYADFCIEAEKEICIWKEHIRTSIVRTIIECAYPYIIEARNTRYGSTFKGKAVVICPPGELHELGARMVADYFTLCGCSVTFVGANTPQDDIISAIKYVKPTYVGISITNYYNLVVTRRLVSQIKETVKEASFRLILGGQACRENPDICRKMGADMVIQTFEELEKLVKGEDSATL
jgi:methanogenic corrinoid protein MtbC1